MGFNSGFKGLIRAIRQFTDGYVGPKLNAEVLKEQEVEWVRVVVGGSKVTRERRNQDGAGRK